MKSLASAVSLLTIIPIPKNWTNNIHKAALYFPAAGFIIGSLYFALAWILNRLGIPRDWQSIFLLIFMTVLTGGIHLDGLADMADGFFGGKNKDQVLKIMKDSATGVFGMLALFFILIIKWTAIKNLPGTPYLWTLILAAVISRFGITLLSGLFNYARKEGTGNMIISNTKPTHAFFAFIYTAIFLVMISGFGTLLVILAGSLISLGMGYYAQNKISGITGDVLGASMELSETVILGMTPFIIPLLPDYMWQSLLPGLNL